MRRSWSLLLIGLVLLSVLAGTACSPESTNPDAEPESQAVQTDAPEPETGDDESDPEPAADSEIRGGPELTDDATNARVRAVIDASANGAQSSRDLFSDVVLVSPALWARLIEADPRLGEVSTTTYATLSATEQYAMGSFRNEEVAELLDSPAFTDLCTRLAQGEVRAATEFEREIYYAFNAWPIAETPVSVVEFGGDALLMDFVDEGVLYLEMVSDWVIE